MPIDHNQIFLAAIIIHSTVLLVTAILSGMSKEKRAKILWKLSLADFLIFPIGLIVASNVQPPTSLLAALAYVAYSLVAGFVLGIEVPGFLLLSKFDRRIVNALEAVRTELVTLGYSFDNMSIFKTTASVKMEMLTSAHLNTLINDFINSSEQMQNLDKTFWGISLAEITASIKAISERSKHPFPKLLDIVSLAGLSFLLAQFLRFLG